jgi:signal transduction histidine kinase
MFTRLFVTLRAQAVAFITALLLLTAVVIFLINQAVERRTTRQVNEYFQSIILAMDLSYRSLAEGKYIADMVNLPNSLPLNSESAVNHIIIVDVENKKVLDSTSREERGKPYDSAGIATFAPGDVTFNDAATTADNSNTVKFTIETDIGKKRDILIVLSMKRLQRVKQAAERDRAIALIVFSALLIGAVAYFAKRFTQPITNLSRAAQRVTAGELDFSVPVGGAQEISTLSGTFNDMLTGLRRNRDLEDQLQRAERSAVVGRLASGIAHEIRNPLNFMNLSIDHLQAACAPEETRKQSEFKHLTTTIKEEIARLNKLVSDFLSYGRPARLNPRELDARTLVEELRTLVKAQADVQNVSVVIAGATAAPFKADAEQIKTCFSNLMINAVQAMPDGGKLIVTLLPETENLRLTFADTGKGIAPENLEQIFEPYYSTKDTGIGLGLPLTKKIIEEHQGQITVESELGRGTTFTVTLPRSAS